MATAKTCLILLSLASVALATGRTPAKVRVMEEKSIGDLLHVEVETSDKIHSYSLRRTLVRAPKMHTITANDEGNIAIESVETESLLPLFQDEELGTRLYKNSREELEGMLSHELALKHEDGQHFVVDTNEMTSDDKGLKDFQLTVPSKDAKRNTEERPEKRNDPSVRQSDESLEYTVELTVLVDSAMLYNFYSPHDLLVYLSVFWNVVNDRFSTVEGLNITVALTDVLVSLNIYGDDYFIEYIDPQHAHIGKTIQKLGFFAYSASWTLPPFDVLQLQTGLSLAYVNPVDNGLDTCYQGGAYESSACYDYGLYSYNIGIALDDAAYSYIRTSTRQLALNLGTPYDGTGGAYYCSCYDGYIMGCTLNPYENNYGSFSPCSSECMVEYYTYDWTSYCLDEISNDYYLEFQGNPGDYVSLNKQCQDRTGYDNAVYDDSVSPDYQCIQLSCVIKKGKASYHFRDIAPALEGTRCPGDAGKCIDGYCQKIEIDNIVSFEESEESREGESPF